ncbi:MAG TPA: class E sortase [Actinomycetota bacterium]|nr:class E sortase [Actinomycetota bacterium]
MRGVASASAGGVYDDVRVLRFPWRKALTAVGISLAVVVAGFLTTNTYTTLWQQSLDARWAEIVAGGGSIVPARGEPVAKMLIPSLGIEHVVLEGQERSILRKGPGHVPGTPLPGGQGNAVIRGHRVLWSGPFRDLHLLNLGSEIHIQTVGGTSTYLVAAVFRQDGSRVDMFEETPLPYLTLVTSDPPLRADGTLVVRAALVERNGEAV